MSDYDLKWLLETVQKVVSGVDMKANKLYIKQEALITFVTMRQGATEPTDGFIAQAKYNAQTLRLAGGECYLYDKDKVASTAAADIDKAIEEYLSMHIMRWVDSVQFGDLQKSLLDSSYKGRDEYPTSFAGNVCFACEATQGNTADEPT